MLIHRVVFQFPRCIFRVLHQLWLCLANTDRHNLQ
nr:MAG TPA: envelope glycoprotein [Caudoviricetes sp.]